jgi:heptosyltransferase-1
MIGVDTGLAHLGAALAVPSVGIIVGTSAQLFSLVSEGKAVTVGDEGVVPSVDAVWRAYEEVVK